MQTPSRVALFAGVLGTIVFAAGPAAAGTPTTWENPTDPFSPLEALVFFGGSTLGLIVVLTLFALLTARHNYTPPPPGKEIHKSPSP